MYKCFNKAKAIAAWTIVLSAAAILFIFSEQCKNGVVDGILLCLGVLIPSLFPFLVLSSFIGESHLCDGIFSKADKPVRLLTGMSGICMVPVIMSLIGGYPVGARTTAALKRSRSINENDAKRLSLICSAAGPGFLVTYIGTSLLCSKESGIILLISQTISIIVLCLLQRLTHKQITETVNYEKCRRNALKLSEAFVSSVTSAIKSCAGMCGFVVVFSVICKVITEGFGLSNITGKVLIALLEITTGSEKLSGLVGLEVISALTGFGGLCVHLQIFTELKGISFSKLRFYLYRAIQAAVCYVSTKIILVIHPVSTRVFSSTDIKPQLTFYSGTLGCITLIVTSLIFISSVSAKKRKQ